MKLDNLLWTIAWHAPFWIVCLLAVILGLVNLSRHKTPALFALLGGAMTGLVSLGSMTASYILWESHNANGGDIEKTILWSRLIGISSAVVEALGIGMIVLAVFSGRPIPRDRDRDRDDRDRDRSDDRPRRDRDRDRRDDRDGGEPLQRASRPPG